MENGQAVVDGESRVEFVSAEGRAARCAGAALDSAAAVHAVKYEKGDDARVALDALSTRHASFEIVPERALGIIERVEECSRRATRWTWGPA